jgi:hypothetical protein
MDDQKANDQRRHSEDFLLAEYQHLMNSFWQSEEVGESRVNFFITLTTAVITALVAIGGNGIPVQDGEVDPIFFWALVASLLFGVVTLGRIIHRNLESHKYLRAANRIRRYFADRDQAILRYLYYGPYDDQPQRKKEWKKWYKIFSLGTGGLVEMVALMNSLIVAALFALLIIWVFGNATSPIQVTIYLLGFVGGIAAWIIQSRYVRRRYRKGAPKVSDINFPSQREIEAALIIWSKTPQVVARKIASMPSIANYRLLPQDSETIRDLYFDTPDRKLQTQKLALRVREIGATRWIALKGPSQPTDWGGVDRLEIEAPWSQDALTRVVKELTDRGFKMLLYDQDFDRTHPLVFMASSGLEVVQNRETHRQVRNVVFRESGPVLAELAIDSVVYHFSDQEICLHEVEIEAKVRDGSTVLKTVIERLTAMYGPVLRRWDHSKLATGMAIEKLLSEGALIGLLDNDGNLTPIAYDKIDDYLTRGDI